MTNEDEIVKLYIEKLGIDGPDELLLSSSDATALIKGLVIRQLAIGLIQQTFTLATGTYTIKENEAVVFVHVEYLSDPKKDYRYFIDAEALI